MGFDVAATNEISDCYASAISLVYPYCDSITNLPPLVRKLATVQLVICELNESTVTTPPSCVGVTEATLSSCIQALERSPQWWTTYTSYFKHINEVCYQYSLPIESKLLFDQYRDSFSNLTTLVQDIGHNLNLVVRSHRLKSKEIVDWTVNELSDQYHSVLTTFPQILTDTMSHWLNKNLPDLIDNQINNQLNTLMMQVQSHMEATISNTMVSVFVHEIDMVAEHLNKSIEAYSSQLHGHVIELESRLGHVNSANICFEAIHIFFRIANNVLSNWYLYLPIFSFVLFNRIPKMKGR
ncbi:hypothetical protein DIRU0_C11782 [Diutina rugosa]